MPGICGPDHRDRKADGWPESSYLQRQEQVRGVRNRRGLGRDTCLSLPTASRGSMLKDASVTLVRRSFGTKGRPSP
jgi:hypothetical protein